MRAPDVSRRAEPRPDHRRDVVHRQPRRGAHRIGVRRHVGALEDDRGDVGPARDAGARAAATVARSRFVVVERRRDPRARCARKRESSASPSIGVSARAPTACRCSAVERRRIGRDDADARPCRQRGLDLGDEQQARRPHRHRRAPPPSRAGTGRGSRSSSRSRRRLRRSSVARRVDERREQRAIALDDDAARRRAAHRRDSGPGTRTSRIADVADAGAGSASRA